MNVECQNTKYMEKLQDKGQKIAYQMEEIMDLGYILGGLVDQIFCAKKMEQDIIILKIQNYDNILASELVPKANLFSKFGLVGNAKTSLGTPFFF